MFAIKKILDPFLQPLGFFFLLAGTGVILAVFKKRKKAGIIIIVVSLAGLWAFSTPLVSQAILRPLERQYPPFPEQSLPEIDFVVVLGGGHNADPCLPVTSHLSGPALSRLVEGLRIYRCTQPSKLVFSGAAFKGGESEAVVMARVACAMGVDPEDIITETKSRDTKDHARFIRPIVTDRPFALVTSAFHMPRAMGMIKKVGLGPVPAPCGHFTGSRGISLVPSARALYGSHRAVHEYYAQLWARIRQQI